MTLILTFVTSLMITAVSSGLTGPDLFDCFFHRVDRRQRPPDKVTHTHVRSEWLLVETHLGLALLAVDDLGWDDLGGRGLGTRAQAFGLGHNHLGDGSRGCDDGWFGPLNRLQALLSLKRYKGNHG